MASSLHKSKAIFFDRDGVVNYRPAGVYISEPTSFKFIPDFLPFFKQIKEAGYLAILITNQQGIGKGLMTEEELAYVHAYMQETISENTGYKFDDIYYCPELSGANSPRRKPNPGMILEAIEKWNIDTSESWMIGDRRSDAIAGKRAGVRTIHLSPLYLETFEEADYTFRNLAEAYEKLFK